MNLWWLTCRALKGMFPDELAVLVATAEGRSLSLFASSKFIRLKDRRLEDLDGEEVEAQMRVELLDQDDRFGLVQFPAQPLDGPRIAKVERQLLSA